MADLNVATEAAPPPPPQKGTPESAAWFRAALEELEQTQASFARLLKRKGDDRQPGTILRNIQRMAKGEARVSGEMRVIITMMRSGKRKAAKQAATANASTSEPACA
jgi:hypothetical protein